MLRIVADEDVERKGIMSDINAMLSGLSVQDLTDIKLVVESYIAGSEDKDGPDEACKRTRPALNLLKGGK